MQTYHWWDIFGSFSPADEKATLPHPGEVVAHYRKLKKWRCYDMAVRLCITASMVRRIERMSVGLDVFSRRRQLAVLLEIPAALLGLDALQEEAFWWIKEEYPPFDAGSDGYPLSGQVIKYYRQRKGKTSSGGVEMRWTQRDLGDAVGVSEVSIRAMENEHKGLDSFSRRQMLAFLLNIPPALLGLDALTHASVVPFSAPAINVPRKFQFDETILNQYRLTQNGFLCRYPVFVQRWLLPRCIRHHV